MGMSNQERRKQSRLEKLGTNDPICGTCGEDDWRCLERSHTAGQQYDPDVVLQCRNCHRKVSDDQKDHPVIADGQNPELYAIGRFMIGFADMLKLIIDKLYQFAAVLFEMSNPQIENGDKS